MLIHMGRLEEAEEMAKKAMSLQFSVFTCNGPACYESMEDMAKIEERRGNLEELWNGWRRQGNIL